MNPHHDYYPPAAPVFQDPTTKSQYGRKAKCGKDRNKDPRRVHVTGKWR